MNRRTAKLLLLGLGVGSLATLLGAVTLVAIQPERSIAEIRLAGTTAKPLAKQLQGKPVVVDIYASWCPKCQNIAPTLSRLKQQYQGKAHFVVFDVSDRTTTQAAEMKAKELGLSEFLAANKSQTSLVAIIDPSNGRVLRQFRNNSNQGDYTAVLDNAIVRMKK
ncbi:MAG: thioredoxin family protein [Leptolyngbyaceae cyanobacterium bins.59]|nr:thioredoxin family protein [Leptolyngbyaceae cyanobacterium bins.59]